MQLEIPPEYNKYYTSTRLHEAGFDSFLTAKVLLRLATKMTGYSKTFVVDTPAADLDRHAASSEDKAEGNTADIYFDPHVDVFGNVTNRPSTGDGSQAVLTINRKNRFQALETHDTRASSQKNEKRSMIPPAGSSFWSEYGNKLRVNGTLEEVCPVGPDLSSRSSFDSFERICPPGHWISP